MSQAIGILELTSIAKGMELGDAMLKSANVLSVHSKGCNSPRLSISCPVALAPWYVKAMPRSL